MASKRTFHILLAESDSDVIEVTSIMLERMGYTVHSETDSLEASSTFYDNPDAFDLAIIEPLMPNLMGLELAIRLRNIRQDFPVLFYTGYLDLPLEQAINDSMVGQTIWKPLGPKELYEVIKERLHHHRPQQA